MAASRSSHRKELRLAAERSRRWFDVASDPNSDEALAFRQASMDAPYHDVASREQVILPLCRGRWVLDIGCVDHSEAGRRRVGFLHQSIFEVAAATVGLDVDADGLRSLPPGLRLCAADAAGPALPFKPGTFDVVIAGEVIEHLDDVGAFLRNLRAVIHDAGAIVLTTPNPFNERRVRAGRENKAVENVDHTLLIFPGGMAELAERCGLRIASLGCTSLPRYSTDLGYSARALGAAWKRWFRRGESNRRRLPLPPDYVSPFEQVRRRYRGERYWQGETAIYVMVPDGGDPR
jgi:SAM-dependent methyltransferase